MRGPELAPMVAAAPNGTATLTSLHFYRWVILFFTWGVFLLTAVDRLAWAPLAADAGASLGLQTATLGVFVSAFYISYVVSNAIGGYFIDWLGGRLMIACAVVPLGLFTFVFGKYTTSITTGVAFQALMGLAAGMDYAACVKLISSWFDHQTRGRALGLFLTGSSVAVVLTNAIVPVLMQQLDWQDVFQIFGAITSAFGVASYFVLRDGPLQPKVTVSTSPKISMLFRNRNLLFLVIAGFGAYWGTWGFAAWANALMIKGYHISTVDAGYVVATFGVGAIIGKPLIGLISDRFGGAYKHLSIYCFLGFAIMLFVFGTLGNKSSFFLAAPFLGLFAFLYTPLMATAVTQQAGVGLTGSATGLTSAFWQLGSTIVPLGVGFAFQFSGSFLVAFLVLAVGPILAAVCMMFVKETQAAPKTVEASAS